MRWHMQKNNSEIKSRLKYFEDKERLKKFNHEFCNVLLKYQNDIQYGEPLVIQVVSQNELGDIHNRTKLNGKALQLLTGRLGYTNSYFKGKKEKFLILPRKEFLLLIIAALDLGEHTDEILATAGYTAYPKNLNEFIILVGIRNHKPLDLIQNKLLDYGYRGYKTIDDEYHFDDEKLDGGELFRDILSRYCDIKDVKIKDVMYQSGLYSVRWDVNKNSYYYEAFLGKGNQPLHFTNEQILRIMEVLKLSKVEQIEFAKELSQNHFLLEDEDDHLFDLIEANEVEYLQKPTKNVEAEKLTANEVSVHTRFINETTENITWEEMDRFIRRNFGSIRSFALFFEDVLQYEGVSISEFITRTGIGKSAFYEYIGGLALPEPYRITVLISMMSRCNEYIYLTLLKKAGKLEFGDKSDSPLIIIMQMLLQTKKNDEILFGKLFDLLEDILAQEISIGTLYEEICSAYRYQCEIIARYLSKQSIYYMLPDEMKMILKLNSKGTQPDDLVLISEKLRYISGNINPDIRKNLYDILMNTYQFDTESKLLRLLVQNEKQLED